MGFVPTDTDFMTIEELSNELGWPLDYTASKALIPYLKRLKGETAKGIEIGTARGESTYLILEQCPNITKAYTIDPFFAYEDWVGPIDQETMDKFKAIAYKNLEKFGVKAEIIPLTSEEAVDLFPNLEYSYLFVDGSHSKENVLKDLTLYYPKVKSGGIVAVHDTNLNTVNDAIKEFREVNKVRQPMNNLPNGVIYWIK